jgi:hypothetical protein
MAKFQKEQPQPEEKVSGSINGFIPPKGTRKMYWVEIINRRIDANEEVHETKREQCFNARDFDAFKADAERIGCKNWKLIWNPEVYGQPE